MTSEPTQKTSTTTTLGIANSALSVTVTVDVWDGDDTSGDDFLGRLTDSYSIDNLWGVAKDHNHRSGDGAATFTVRSSHPYDQSKFRQNLFWSFRTSRPTA